MVLRRDRELVHITFHNGPGQLYIRLSIGRGASPRNAWAQGNTAELHRTVGSKVRREVADMLLLFFIAFTFQRFSRQAAWVGGPHSSMRRCILGVTLNLRIARMLGLSIGLGRNVVELLN